MPLFRDALLAGYRTHREIDATHLDDFIALRQVAFDLWFTGTAQVNPAFADEARRRPPVVAVDARSRRGTLRSLRTGEGQRLSAYTCSMISSALVPSAGSIQNGLPAAACAWKSAISSSWDTPQ